MNKAVLLEALFQVRRLLAQPYSGFSMSPWRDAGEALEYIDDVIECVERNSVDEASMKRIFALFGPVHLVAIESARVPDFLNAVSTFDTA